MLFQIKNLKNTKITRGMQMITFAKSKWSKMVSILLVAVMLFTIIDVPLAQNVKAAETTTEPQTSVTKENPTPVEVPSENTEYATIYDNGDGTKTAYVYSEPIRYEDENGKLTEIDNSIIPMTEDEKTRLDKKGYYAKNKSNITDVYLPENLTDKENNVLVEKDKYKIEMKPLYEKQISLKDGQKPSEIIETEVKKEDGTTTKEPTSIKYKSNFDENVFLEYVPTNNGVKQNIILNEKPESNIFSYEVKLEGLYPEKQDDGRILLKDSKTEKVVGQFQECFMTDSSESYNYSDDITMNIEAQSNNIYKLTFKADEGFLNDSQNKYPITIDPSVTVTGTANTFDSYVQEAYQTSNYSSSDNLRVGYDSTTGKVRSYIAFNLPDIAGGLITDAKVKFYELTGNTTAAYIDLYRPAANWWGTTINWSNQPGTTGSYYDRKTVNSSGYYEWAIPGLVSQWYSGAIPNYGIVLKDSAENLRYRKFYSSESATSKPVLTITYTPKPAAPSLAMASSGINTGTNYANLSWNSVSGATSYKVGIFNGYQWEFFDAGANTTYSTMNMKIWPTPAEINAMVPPSSTILHNNVAGVELANDPAILYAKQNQGYGANHAYYFMLRAYNSYGQYTDSNYIASNAIDSTSPNQPSAVSTSIVYAPLNCEDEIDLTATWPATTDLPTFSNSGIKQYRAQLYINGSLYRERITFSNSVLFDYINDNCSAYVRVMAEDNNGNTSFYTQSSTLAIPDRTGPVMPSSFTIDTSSWTNNTSPTISWTGITDEGNNLQSIQYKKDNGTWADTGNNSSSGSYVLNLSSLSDGQHTITIRGIDSEGNIGAEKSVSYYKDTTTPTAEINSPSIDSEADGIVNIYATINDLHLLSWRLEEGSGISPTTYSLLKEGTNLKVNDFIYSLDTSGFIEQSKHKIRLTTTDIAGNSKEYSVILTKSLNPQNTEKKIDILDPLSNTIINNAQSQIEYSIVGLDKNLYKEKLFINNHLVQEESISNEGLFLNALNYQEGTSNEIMVKTTDESGNDFYSVISHKKTIYSNTFTTINDLVLDNAGRSSNDSIKITSGLTGTVEVDPSKTVSFAGKIDSIKLVENSVKPVGTSITYKVKLGDGSWISINPNSKIAIDTINNGMTNESKISIKAELSSNTAGVTPEILNWQLEAVYLDAGQSFDVKLLDEPSSLTAFPNADYKTLLRWNSTYSENEGVTYNIYRSKNSEFMPSETTLIAENINDKYWYDYNLDYGQTFYYKATAIKNFDNTTRESIASNEAFAKVVDEDELNKRLGLQNYWGYSTFSTGSGTGYIEASKGNLVYQATDTVVPGPYLAMVMKRTYNSQATSKTALGSGWDFSFNTSLMKEYLTTTDPGTGLAVTKEVGMILKDGDGTLHRFLLKDTDSNPNTFEGYMTPKGIFMELTVDANGVYKIKRNDNIEYTFNQSLQIIKFSEPNGNELNLAYDTSKGYLNSVTNEYGDILTLNYNQEDLLESVIQPDGQIINYSYDNQNRLDEVSQTIDSGEIYHEKYDYVNDDFRVEDPGQCKHNSDIANLFNKWYTSIDLTGSGKVIQVNYANGEYNSVNIGSNLCQVTNDKNKTTSLEFESTGLITKRTAANGRWVSYTHDDNYKITGVAYQNIVDGVVQNINNTYTYDNKGNLLTAIDAMGNITSYGSYNNFNDPSSISTPKNETSDLTVSYSYDNLGNIVGVTDPAGRQVTNNYLSNGLIDQTTNEYGSSTSYDYNNKGQLIKVTDALGYESEILSYNSMGKPLIVKDKKGNITSYSYDKLGRNTSVTYPDGNSESWVYDLNNNVIKYMNRRGIETKYEYDALNRQIKTILGNDGEIVTDFSYGVDGNLIVTQTDPAGKASKSFYNEVGNLVKEESGGTYVNYEYDFLGNRVKITDEDGKIIKSEYDILNRQTKTIIVDSVNGDIIKNVAYDLLGNVLTSIDGEGDVTTYTYDNLSRLTTVVQTVEGTDQTTAYSYDIVAGDKIKNIITFPNGNQKETYLDKLGRITEDKDLGDPNSGTSMHSIYTYDANGNLILTTKNDGVQIENLYNNLNQLSKTIYEKDASNNPKKYTDYTYDLNGNRTCMKDYDSTLITEASYAYDELDRLIQKVQDGDSITFAYDESGNTKMVTYPDASSVTEIYYTYNADNLLERVSVKKQGLSEAKTAREYFYTASSKLDYTKDYRQFETSQTDYIQTDYDYNNIGLVNKLEYKDSTNLNEIKASYSYTYDKKGYIQTESIIDKYPTEQVNATKSYLYDDIGRLKSATNLDNLTSTTTTTGYTYDNMGNRLTMNNGTDNFSYSYNEFNQLTNVAKNGQANFTTYQYDSRGNQIKETTKKQVLESQVTVTTDFTYDKADRLTETAIAYQGYEGTQNTYNTYNGDGQRVKRLENGYGTKFYYVGLDLLFTSDVNNNKVTENILDPSGSIVASKRFDGNYANMYYFYQYDIRGSVTDIVQPDGTMVKGYNYDEYGNSKTKGNSSFINETTFTGAVADKSNGLYYMNARFYNPESGRFLSKDTYPGSTSDPVTQNLYTYGNNNPTNMVDPTGHFALPALAVGAFVGALTGLVVTAVADYADDGKFNSPHKKYLGSAVNGAITGVAAVATCGASLARTAIGMGIASAAGSYYNQKISTGKVSSKQVIKDGVIGGVLGAAGKTLGQAVQKGTSKAVSASVSKGGLEIDVDTVIDSANAMKKGGESVVGHALQKHAGRNPDIWGKIKGNAGQINETAMNHLDDILSGSGDFKTVTTDKGVKFLEKLLPDGRGVRLNMDGTFKGFIDQIK
ncbi:MAG: DNRLRE domain-containing protein [Eubacteriaceae bacterium]|nr:DNRLRE domain-containing protein [Eubacteriaceae bacterium]